MILALTTKTMKLMMAPKAAVTKKEARKKIKVAREAPGPRRPALKLRIRSLQLVLRRAVPVGGAEMRGFVDVQLSLDTYGVWAGYSFFFFFGSGGV